jgi:spore germination cell wall hydrolase CwlJ-like protein
LTEYTLPPSEADEPSQPQPASANKSLSRSWPLKVWAGLVVIGIALAVVWSGTRPAPDTGRGPRSPILSGSSDSPVMPNLFKPIAPEDAFAQNLARPIEVRAIEPQRPFTLPLGLDESAEMRAFECLTQAIYYEAASETTQGQRAVAQVILNRVRSALYPHSVCATVYQGSNLPTGCQFTFTCDGSLLRKPSRNGWERAQAVARAALNGLVEPSVGTATHYHTVYVIPYWASSLQKIALIGNHVFYRMPGRLGERSAFTSSYTADQPVLDESPVAAAAAILEQVESLGQARTDAVAGAETSGLLAGQQKGVLAVPVEPAKPHADQDRGQLKIDGVDGPVLNPGGTKFP